MRKGFCFARILLFGLILSVAGILQAQAPQAPPPALERNFSFIHISDSHVSPAFEMPQEWDDLRSWTAIQTIKDLGEIKMPGGGMAPRPSFIIHTGDIAEFSFPGVTWSVVEKYFESVNMPIYFIAGNHDNTWVMDTGIFRRLHGGMNYSFEHQGFRFIGLCSASYQEPVESLGEEVLVFLKNELQKVSPQTPLFIFFHHPLQRNSFSSRYDVDRIIDALRGYNVVLMMDGHGHQAVRHNYDGIDGIEGGSPFSKGEKKTDGYNIVHIRNNELAAGYYQYKEGAIVKELIKKKIPESEPYPQVSILTPRENEEIRADTLKINVQLPPGEKSGLSVTCQINDSKESVALNITGNNAVGDIPLTGAFNGAHYLRITMKIAGGREFSRSTVFYLERTAGAGLGRSLWRYRMKGACKTAPLVANGVVYAGSNDGLLHALDLKSGKALWTFDAGAEILGGPASWNNLILFGAGNGNFYAVNTKGEPAWVFDAGAAVYSPPSVYENAVYFGNNRAKIFALDIATGKQIWVNSDARYSVESKPLVTADRVYFGAWDGYVYALDRTDGKQVWRQAGPKNKVDNRVITYYGPADDGPVMLDGHLFISDRGYVLGKYMPDGAWSNKIAEGCSAIGLSQDGRALYLRNTSNPLRKISSDGGLLWESTITFGRLPIAPVEKDGMVYACTNTGRLFAMKADTGQAVWEYQVTPGLYVMAGVAVHGGVAITAGQDGVLTAVAGPGAVAP